MPLASSGAVSCAVLGFSIALGIAVYIGQQVSNHQMAERSEIMQAELGGKDLEKDIALTHIARCSRGG
jgi:uncharacterized protein HemX